MSKKLDKLSERSREIVLRRRKTKRVLLVIGSVIFLIFFIKSRLATAGEDATFMTTMVYFAFIVVINIALFSGRDKCPECKELLALIETDRVYAGSTRESVGGKYVVRDIYNVRIACSQCPYSKITTIKENRK